MKEVPERLKINEEALRRYLTERLPWFQCPPGGLVVKQFSHGESNPTYHLAAPGAAGELVLRRRPPGKLLPGAHRVSTVAGIAVENAARDGGGANLQAHAFISTG